MPAEITNVIIDVAIIFRKRILLVHIRAINELTMHIADSNAHTTTAN